jgi:two-component system sensor histidine kinase RegB
VLISLPQITQLRLIQLRWLSVLVMLLAALISPHIIGTPSLMSPLLALVTVIGCANACLHLAFLFSRDDRNGLPLFTPLVQLSLDLLAWSSYVFMSGGATNPLISVFLPLVGIGAIVLSPSGAWMFGVATIGSYSLLWHFYQPLAVADAQSATHLHLLGMWLVFAISAVVLIWFILKMTQTIRGRDAELAATREKAIRNDWLVSLGSLAASAAHDLSTPLGTLNILAEELLHDPQLPPALRPDLELMGRQIERCKQALTQLTQLAAHPRETSASLLPVTDWLQRQWGAWQSLNPGVSLTIQLAPTLEQRHIQPDITIERAIANLLDNALRAGAREIRLQAGEQDTRLLLQVADDGCGIAAPAQQAFAAGQPAASDSGLGIGLLLARAAIERRGGRLELAACPAGGSLARIELPLPPGGLP